MPLPDPIVTGAAVGQFLDPLGRPLRGNVIIRYDRPAILADGTTPPATIIARSKAFPLDDDGNLNATGIIVSDSPGLRWDQVGLTATATFALSDEEGAKRPRAQVPFRLTLADPVQDLTKVGPIDDQGGFPTWPIIHEVPVGTGATPGWFLKLISVSPLVYGWAAVPGGGGGGSVNSVNDVTPDSEGNVELTPGAIGAQPAGDYVDDAQLAQAISDALAGYATTASVSSAISTAVAPLATIEMLNDEVALLATNAELGAVSAVANNAKSIADANAQQIIVLGQNGDALFGRMNDFEDSRAQPNGIATLDGGGKLPQAQLPAIAVVDFLGAVNSQAAMLALVGQKGDWTTRTDRGTDWTIIGNDPTQLSSWLERTYPGSPVSSVFGRTGAVTGSKADVGLGNVDDTADSNKPVSTAQQQALDGKYTLPAGGVPRADLASDVRASLAAADTAVQPAVTNALSARISTQEARPALIALGPSDPVPAGTPAGSWIARS